VAPPAFIHAKHLSIDDDIAVIRSSNMDIRSFQLGLEVTLVCYDTQIELPKGHCPHCMASILLAAAISIRKEEIMLAMLARRCV
jgi:phosphatidylserine/phosphatidylglycerophosphate/cardiolipin synthase-like enzyme